MIFKEIDRKPYNYGMNNRTFKETICETICDWDSCKDCPMTDPKFHKKPMKELFDFKRGGYKKHVKRRQNQSL